MHFKVQRLKLLNALSKVSRAVSIRAALPVLQGIKFELTNSCLVLTGSSYETTIQSKIFNNNNELEILETGGIVLNSKYILEIIKKINDDIVEINIIDGFLTRIQGSNIEFNLNGTDPIEYPHISINKSGLKGSLNSILLKNIVSETKFAASDNETRPILTGINFKASNKQLECVATDSYRLAKKMTTIDENIEFNITIPKAAIDEVSKIIEKNEDITFYVTDRSITFDFDNNTIQTRLIDGKFPDTSKLIPPEFSHYMTINKQVLLNAIDRVSLLLNEQNNIIKLQMDEENVIISSSQQEIGNVEEVLSDAFYKGNDLSISFSNKYASDAIKSFKGEKIVISFNGEMKPFVIKDMDNNDLLQLLLPVRTY